MTPEDQRELAGKFEAVDGETGHEVLARLANLAEELEAQVTFGRSV